MNRSEWLNTLKPIKKGKKLDQTCVVVILDKNRNFSGYGAITKIIEDSIYFNYFAYDSRTYKYLLNKFQRVDKETGEYENYYLDSLNLESNENELVIAISIIGKVLKECQKKKSIISLIESLQVAITALEKDTKINPILRHQTLANLYQILEEFKQK